MRVRTQLTLEKRPGHMQWRLKEEVVQLQHNRKPRVYTPQVGYRLRETSCKFGLGLKQVVQDKIEINMTPTWPRKYTTLLVNKAITCIV